jgi:hypothetical protein
MEKQPLFIILEEVLEPHYGSGLQAVVRARIWKLWIQVFEKCWVLQRLASVIEQSGFLRFYNPENRKKP